MLLEVHNPSTTSAGLTVPRRNPAWHLPYKAHQLHCPPQPSQMGQFPETAHMPPYHGGQLKPYTPPSSPAQEDLRC